jgi:hypothetical protein
LTAVENYFNYFTEIEECYRRCRSSITKLSPMLLLSPVDWALIESWKEAEYPLEAVLRGIEHSFEKFKARPRKYRLINSLAYCSQEVVSAVAEARAGEVEGGSRKGPEAAAPPFTAEDILNYLGHNIEAIGKTAGAAGEKGDQVLEQDLAAVVTDLAEVRAKPAEESLADLQGLERHFTVLEEKLAASLLRASPVELLRAMRTEVERGLAPSRRRMTAVQIESLERQYLKKRLFEHYKIPRLSLFYL